MWHKLGILLEMIKFKHSVFALPFALMAVCLAARGLPPFSVLFWVIVAMVGARTAAMTFNRIVDRRFDAANPRTASRALPAGLVSTGESWLLLLVSSVLFFLACAMINRTTLMMAPFALALTFFYSLSKRFTWLCHLVLGLALALAPLGGWAAVRDTFAGYPWALSLGVLFWVAGFDCIYACLDADFDRSAGLYSMPAVLGSHNSFRLAGVFHGIAFILFTLTGILMQLNAWYYGGIVITGAALLYQHAIVKPEDLSRIRQSFFTMNGLIALVLFAATCLSLLSS